MNASGSSPEKDPGRDGEEPSLTCAICKRRYQPISIPGMHTIYSICPDCRLDIPSDTKID